jgi:hypothetical protein
VLRPTSAVLHLGLRRRKCGARLLSAVDVFLCERNKEKAAIVRICRKVCSVCNPLVGPARSERVVWIWHLFSDFNGCFGDTRCVAARNLLHLLTNAASAKPEK